MINNEEASSLPPVKDNTPFVGTPGKAPKASSDQTIAAPVSKPAGRTTPTAGV